MPDVIDVYAIDVAGNLYMDMTDSGFIRDDLRRRANITDQSYPLHHSRANARQRLLKLSVLLSQSQKPKAILEFFDEQFVFVGSGE